MVPTNELRGWAKGSYPLEAATELLIRAFNGRFAAEGNPWIQPTDYEDRWVLDADSINADTTGALSGGEKRFLRIVGSLAGGAPVNLNEDVPGLDRGLVQLVLAAIAHAAGSHEHSDVQFDDSGRVASERLPSLYPWPASLHLAT